MILVIPAAFVPEGEDPPPDLASVFDPLRIPATLDPTTGAITCDGAGSHIDGDLRAEWHPDGDGDAEGDEPPSGEDHASPETPGDPGA